MGAKKFEARIVISRIGAREAYLPGTGIGDAHL